MKKWTAAVLAGLLVWNVWLTWRTVSDRSEQQTVPTDPEAPTIINNTLNGYTTDITGAADRVRQNIVTVRVQYTEDREYTASGVIYRSNAADTYIVTCSSFLEGAQSLFVLFDNGIEIEAELFGSDPQTDTAVLLCHPEFVAESIELGDSSMVRHGEYGFTLSGRNVRTDSGISSFGIVSMEAQLYRETENASPWITGTLLSDVVISDFSVGSPLLNMDGEMIGMLSRRLSRGDTVTGLTYALASNELRLVCDDLIRDGHVSRGYLGIVGRNISDLSVYEKSAWNLPLDISNGILITYVYDGSPAQQLDMRPGDLILSADDVALQDMEELRDILYARNPEDALVLGLLRDGEASISVSAVLR